MNATHSIDQLQAITHVGNILGTANIKVGDAAASKPKTATTSHYDQQGQNVGSVSKTSYDGLTLAADGTITCGSLSHESTSVEGAKLATTSIGFAANGKPASADINVHKTHTDGDFKQISMDMSGATWNDSFAISSGQVKMSSVDNASKAKTHEGTINFDKESLVSGSFTHYSKDKPGDVAGYSQLDYSQAKFLGTRLVGGQYSIAHQNADKSLSSNSLVSVSPAGTLNSIETTNLDANSAVKTKVTVDFSGMQFNARNEMHSGDLKYTAHDGQGNKLSDTVLTYQDAKPARSEITAYNGNAVRSKVIVDYSQSVFNNDKQVVSSTKKVDIYSGDNKLLTSLVVAYDENGAKLAQGGTTKPVTPKTLQPPVLPKIPPVRPVAASQNQQRDEKRRPDNTLEQVRLTTLQDGKPVSALVTNYAADGTTVVKTHAIDFGDLNYDPNSKAISGALSMQTHLGGTVLQAASSIEY